jgi:hypothetical protein
MICQYSWLYAIHENWHATKLRTQRICVTKLICFDNRTEPTKLRIQENPIFAHTIEVFYMVWLGLDWVYGVQRQFQQYFSYMVAISFIGGVNQSTWRKPPICRISLTNCIT